ncbi:T3SS effector NleG family protein [Salmonella enterica]
MPLSFPNVYLNTRGRIETLSLNILDSIRNAAREMPDSTDIQVQLRDALYRVRHQPDDGTFEVAPWREPGQGYSYIRQNHPQSFSNARRLALQLNERWNLPGPIIDRFLNPYAYQAAINALGIQSDIMSNQSAINGSETQSDQLHKKIEACSFPVDTGSFLCAEEYLKCPITLDIPKNGVFVKVSSQSDVCYLFSKEELLKLVDQKLSHPLSREPIRMDMIVRKRDCYFNTLRDTFASV